MSLVRLSTSSPFTVTGESLDVADAKLIIDFLSVSHDVFPQTNPTIEIANFLCEMTSLTPTSRGISPEVGEWIVQDTGQNVL